MNAKVGQSQFGPSVVRLLDTRRPAASSRGVLPRGQRQLVEQSLLRYSRRDGKPRS